MVFSSPLWSPAPDPAVVAVEHRGLDELAETGNAAVLHVSPCPSPREPARDQEPDVASTEDHQELLGHHLEGAREGSEQGIPVGRAEETSNTIFSLLQGLSSSARSRTAAKSTDKCPRSPSWPAVLSPQGVTPSDHWPAGGPGDLPALSLPADSQRASTCTEFTQRQ